VNYRRGLITVVFAGLVTAAYAAESPRSEMAVVFQAMSELIGLSTSPEGFTPERVHPQAAAAFGRLSDASMAVLDHAESQDADFLALSAGLVKDVESARLAFELGRFEDARFRVNLVISRCIECHSRLPDLADSSLADRWLESAQLQRLPDPDRARLLTATRRFDEAMETWEAVFRDPAQKPIEAEVFGWIHEYLSISIRVKRDLKRPRPVLQQLARRPDTPQYLMRRLLGWADALAAVEGSPSSGEDGFAQAHELISAGLALERSSFADVGLIHDLAASSLLLSWIDSRGEARRSGTKVAEAWYLLGRIESRIESDAWFSRMETYMDAAVRAAPSGPLAELAYEALEESLLLSFGASTADGLPSGERERLDELRELLPSDAPLTRTDASSKPIKQRRNG
jgi:hypothetical protein